MVTSPDGMGIMIVGGGSRYRYSNVYRGEKRIIESRFDGSNFLPWNYLDQELKNGRDEHVVIPIPKSITKCN